jgi:O-acetyl-ADP-ribose deacetylase (regulator of RNase III)
VNGDRVQRSGPPRIRIEERHGDLLAQRDVEALVNPWNRNFIPRWLLRPGGVSKRLRARTGPGPWKELAGHGTLQLGQAVLTDGGDLPVDLIHVAGINTWWRASPTSVELSCRNAVDTAWTVGHASMAMPLIGAGHGRLDDAAALAAIRNTLATLTSGDRDAMTVRVVIF